MKIYIIDYQAGNLANVQKAFEHLGYQPQISSNPDDLKTADLLILPGVGAFEVCVQNLKKANLDQVIKSHIEQQKPFLGICLGFQMLFEYSEENGLHEGLGIFKGGVKAFKAKIPANLKIPQMGWNQLQIKNDPDKILAGLNQTYVYFVHSYYVDPDDKNLILSKTNYGISFASAISAKNLLATQFHPEKSGAAGLKILENFMRSIEPFPSYYFRITVNFILKKFTAVLKRKKSV